MLHILNKGYERLISFENREKELHFFSIKFDLLNFIESIDITYVSFFLLVTKILIFSEYVYPHDATSLAFFLGFELENYSNRFYSIFTMYLVITLARSFNNNYLSNISIKHFVYPAAYAIGFIGKECKKLDKEINENMLRAQNKLFNIVFSTSERDFNYDVQHTKITQSMLNYVDKFLNAAKARQDKLELWAGGGLAVK